MADTIHAYSRKWRFKLSPTKSAVVVFGPLPPNKESPKVSFSSENLPVLDAYTYFNQSINQSKRKTSNANGQTNLGHKHKAPDHNHEATQPMVDLPHTS